jgi:hypothetical protein
LFIGEGRYLEIFDCLSLSLSHKVQVLSIINSITLFNETQLLLGCANGSIESLYLETLEVSVFFKLKSESKLDIDRHPIIYQLK